MNQDREGSEGWTNVTAVLADPLIAQLVRACLEAEGLDADLVEIPAKRDGEPPSFVVQTPADQAEEALEILRDIEQKQAEMD